MHSWRFYKALEEVYEEWDEYKREERLDKEEKKIEQTAIKAILEK